MLTAREGESPSCGVGLPQAQAQRHGATQPNNPQAEEDVMGLLTGLFKIAVDTVTLPVAAVVDIVTAGQAGATDQAAKKLARDVEDTLNGGDGNLL